MASSDRPDGPPSEGPEQPSDNEAEAGPITPHAAPVLDAAGNITYIGDDGRRYVVGLPAGPADPLLERIVGLCELWLTQQCSSGLDPRHALVVLLTALDSALQPPPSDP